LMVSSFRYYSFKEFNLGERIPFTKVILIPAVFVLISLNPPIVMFVLFAFYAATGPVTGLYRVWRRRSPDTDLDKVADVEPQKDDKSA
ncbi:MAG: hypothetical protein KJO35_08525, partial [Gammaproteobacteria bacterium]|nr:hypothetical protein [Gammaproteobacteria bacterium]